MVGVPNSTTDPKLVEITKPEDDGQMKKIEDVVNEIDNVSPFKNTIIIPRIIMSSEKDGSDAFVLAFNDNDNNGQKKLECPADQVKAVHNLLEKLPGDESLSSGSSIVTISSAANSDPEAPNDSDPRRKPRDILNERWQHTALQVSVPFFIAGIGTIGAGLVLDNVQTWDVFKQITQLLILVPSLLGLKGNLDMCLASRLCTQANLGNMHGCREIVKMIIGNLALVQIQATVAAIIVSIFATSAHAAMTGGDFLWDHALLVTASSVCTATSSCFFLDLVMIIVIMTTHRWKMNPDNLATPLAASFGDVVSITVFSHIASSFFTRLETQIWILYVVIIGYLLILPIWIWIVLKNKYTKKVLTSGWTPVLSALFISGLGGLVLSKAADVPGFSVFQPIINGIGGNLVSVQASRISSTLHQTSLMGVIPEFTKLWISPWKALFKGVPFAKTARLLITMGVIGELIFIYAADYIKQGESTLHFYFIFSYIMVALFQIMLLLYVAHIIIHAMWRFKIDPDNSAIPYLTALGDLSGTIFLGGAFWLLREIGHPYNDLQEMSP
ncbi:solute carrier family 41 member 3 [Microplitis demolitor]|uniref:solute carrier family 41 member 3 n=1 Tax=Microplitis demolitor TaxID=69319 RepID=UPI0004CCD15C|nr:solute carrier family 41 member 3 [Microplitis demolitor]